MGCIRFMGSILRRMIRLWLEVLIVVVEVVSIVFDWGREEGGNWGMR